MLKSNLFNEELALIENEPLRNLVTDYLDNVVPDYFWEIPASSTGKYHPWYSLGYGGLYRHTKAALKIAIDLLLLEQNADLNKDEIITALIIHDTFKLGKDKSEFTVFDHPFQAAIAFTQLTIEKLSASTVSNISQLVASHMGQWNTKENEVDLPKPNTKAEQFVHTCDYLASRKYLTVEVC